MAFGDVISSAASPAAGPNGIGGNASVIWHCDRVADDVYELDVSDFSVVSNANSPYLTPTGIGGDASTIWHCDEAILKVYELDVSDFSTVRSDDSPVGGGSACSGIGGDASTIWFCDRTTDDVYELSTVDFSIVSNANSPSTYPFGIGGDVNIIWHCDKDADNVYELAITDFSVVVTAASPQNTPKGIGGDQNTLWHCDHDAATAYELNAGANYAPTAPTSLLCEGQTNPTDVTDLTPEFSAVYNDPDAGDIANAYEIHLATTEAGIDSPNKWNSGWVAMTIIEGNRSANITYAGSTLSINLTYYWKIRFRDDNNAEGAWSAVSSFSTGWSANWFEKQTLYPKGRFIYDDIVETQRVEGWGVISRASNAIISGGTSLVLINTDKYWNKFLADRSNLRRTAKIQLGTGVLNTIARSGIARSGITVSNLVQLAPGSTTSSGIYIGGQGQWLDLFTGWADDPEFVEAVVNLPLRDKFAGLLERELGSEESPLDYYSSAYNPADLAWALLVTHGGQDSTTSSDNVDIDYTTWSTWKTMCSAANFSLKARFTGQSIREALELIRDLTHSAIYVAGNGKIKFFFFSSSTVAGGVYHFNEDRFNMPSVRLDSEKIINYVKVYYDYDPVTETWDNYYLKEDTTSQQNPPDGYGLSSETINNVIVWHATLTSAGTYADRRVAFFSEPTEVVSFRSFMMGMEREIGDLIQFTYPFLDYLGDYFRINKITAIDLANGSITFEAGVVHDYTFPTHILLTLDLFEYSTDALAQAAYVSSLSPSPTPQLWSRLDSGDDVTIPQAGTGGSVQGQPSFGAPFKFGNSFGANVGHGAKFPTVANDINMDKGTIEFWARFNFERTQHTSNCYLFSFRSESPYTGIYFYWDVISKELSLNVVINNAIDASFYSSGFTWTIGDAFHFAVTWDRTGADIGASKTLVLYIDDAEEESTTTTWAAGTPNPNIYLGTSRGLQAPLVGRIDNFKTYNVCKTDFSDKDVEDPNELQCYSESTIKQQGSYSLKIFARDTDSLNGTLTRTVSPTIDLSDLVEIRFEARASRTGSNFKIAIHDSGGTTTEHTVNIIAADTWQTEIWSILGLANSDKDAIDSIIITIVNASADNTIYIDKIQVFA